MNQSARKRAPGRKHSYQSGDHLRLPLLPGIYHHLIVEDETSGIHLGTTASGRKSVCRQPLDHILRSVRPHRVELVHRPDDPALVVARARSALTMPEWTQQAYNFITHNCEHFCNWCVDGWRWSQQVLRMGGRLLMSGVTLLLRGISWLIPGLGWLVAGAAIATLIVGSGCLDDRNYQ